MDNKFDRVIREPLVMGGQARIRDTNITVNEIVRLSLDGMSQADILAKYLQLEAEDIHQALAYMIPELSSLHVNSFQEIGSSIAALNGWTETYLSGNPNVTSEEVVELSAVIAKILRYKSIYYIVRARLLYPWYEDSDWGKTKLKHLSYEVKPFTSPHTELELHVSSEIEEYEVDNRLVRVIGFLTQMQKRATITIEQKQETILFLIAVHDFDMQQSSLALVDELADSILRQNKSRLVRRDEETNIVYEFELPI